MTIARNNSYGDMPFGDMPPELFEKIIKPGMERKARAMNGEKGADPISIIMKRLDAMERMMAQLSQAVGQEEPDGGQNEEMQPLEAPAKSEQNLPSFIRGEFAGDFKQKPAEAMLNLLTDIYGRMPEKMDSPENPLKDMMGLFKNISRQVRKDRLFEKNDDARDMIEKIEETFREIPEIEKRADAYEIAYNLVKSKLTEGVDGAENGKKPPAGNEKSITRQPEERMEKSANKEMAFVENSGKNRINRGDQELSPLQKEICRKMGISESSFRKYMKK